MIYLITDNFANFAIGNLDKLIRSSKRQVNLENTIGSKLVNPKRFDANKLDHLQMRSNQLEMARNNFAKKTGQYNPKVKKGLYRAIDYNTANIASDKFGQYANHVNPKYAVAK